MSKNRVIPGSAKEEQKQYQHRPQRHSDGDDEQRGLEGPTLPITREVSRSKKRKKRPGREEGAVVPMSYEEFLKAKQQMLAREAAEGTLNGGAPQAELSAKARARLIHEQRKERKRAKKEAERKEREQREAEEARRHERPSDDVLRAKMLMKSLLGT